MDRQAPIGGMILIGVAAVLWGTTGTTQALAPGDSSPPVIGALRLLVGGAGLLLYSLLRNPASLRGMPVASTLAAGAFVAAYQLCFFWGVSLTGVAVGTMVGIGSAPVFAGIIDAVFMAKRPGRRWYAATGLALLGCIMLLGSAGGVEINPLGIVLAAGAGLSYSIYTLFMKRLLPDRSAEPVAALVFCSGALFLLPVLVVAELSWVVSPAGAIVVVHLGLLATAVSYVLFCKGLKYVPVSTAVTLTLAEPFTAGLLGFLVLGERVNMAGWLGLALILSGLVLLAIPSGRSGRQRIATDDR